MKGFSFIDADYLQMESLGITEEQVRRQIEIFEKSSYFVHLKHACVLGNGIQIIPASEKDRYLQLHFEAARKGRFLKFVPASGAATRMFQSLMQIYHMPQFLEFNELQRRAGQGVAVACDFIRFVEELFHFPFIDDLEDVLARDGFDLDMLVRERRFLTILEYLLTDYGLNYSSLPKGLLKFHRYKNGSRTAFEEHLVEAADYLGNGNGVCCLHFTVSPEHEQRFLELLDVVEGCYENRFEMHYSIDFSYQKPSTNTIAVDMFNRPFRDRHGHLLFRPAGHGALLENLNDLQGDLIFIKNVDNVVPDNLKEDTVVWKRILGGYLVEIQNLVFDTIRKLKQESSESDVEKAASFARERLSIRFPETYEYMPLEKRRDLLLRKLNRPIRVCGVVRNVGEPGGAPFWVENKNGTLSLQIVEKAQVDFSQSDQEQIWMSSTHFNPVDLVCGVRDYEGKPFNLGYYVDPETVFISRKFKEGRELKALELPGLWNGSMADWITVIVEVPRTTFNPVKTVFDLLKPEHLSGFEQN
ncbi:DUF4301 family protein [Desulforhabdus amnigena]|jgi:hypothetical protein|uniref:DUF4301 domain-containing protein n=1 Tax=Desulforhabdus amnigena TaxID=40218 RepID=A0A9W6FTA3_9BACT|nr:DUF4301 family protein [Desulforhabdus amnigena]NLJ28339.1 DUF4301 family protein [Deltaproteobacteria bacterium]GLI33380.1 hypothetical protein DAMNIGENAA_08130 [Desulforhabdus amnigena]